MRGNSFFEERGRVLVGGMGLLLLFLSIGTGVWVAGIVNQALYHPNEIPLFQSFSSSESTIKEFQLLETQESVSARFPHDFLLFVVLGFLLAALGAIVSGMISGGVRLLGVATGLLPRIFEKKGTGG